MPRHILKFLDYLLMSIQDNLDAIPSHLLVLSLQKHFDYYSFKADSEPRPEATFHSDTKTS